MKIQSGMVDDTFSLNPLKWLTNKAQEHHLKYLLLHDADGIAWGQLYGDEFKLSFEVFPSDLDQFPIRTDTLLQVRMFDADGELFLWKTAEGITYRLILDEDADHPSLPDDFYWLWGTGLLTDQGFTLMNEGQQGLRHAPPVGDVKDNQRLGLQVRHYIEEADDGWQRIKMSRLVGLKLVEGGEK